MEHFSSISLRNDFISSYTSELRQRLEETEDAPTALLIAVILLIHKFNAVIVHASGKFVSAFVTFLCASPPVSAAAGSSEKRQIPRELAETIVEMQKLVVSSFRKTTNKGSGGGGSENLLDLDTTTSSGKLAELIVELRQKVLTEYEN